MNIFQSLILGLVQGIAEFMPISSSGHLVLLQRLFGIEQPGAVFEVLMHVATLFAVVAIYWEQLLDMVFNFKDGRLLKLLVATVPAVLVALVFGDAINAAFSGNMLGLAFLITAFLLILPEWLLPYIHQYLGDSKPREEITYLDALGMGVMQAIGTIPGISRSGAIISGGLLMGLKRKTAADFAFMMAIPAILGSAVLEAKHILSAPELLAGYAFWPLLLGMLAAAFAGYFAIKYFMIILRKYGLKWFALYTGILGLLIVLDQIFFHFFF